MGARPGQVSGQGPGFTWADFVDALVRERGSLAAVALALVHAGGRGEDAASVERALRRLRAKGSADGGAWGARALRCFGLPSEAEARVRWMGLYHSRFCDLPVSVCRDLLRVWDRPPVAESSARVYVVLGLAHCALRAAELDEATALLDRARAAAGKSSSAHCEERLARAYATANRGDHAGARRELDEALALVATLEKSNDVICFEARAKDQLAYLAARERDPDHARARALYASIPDAGPPFARAKRAIGLGYVAWRTANRDEAVHHARAAVSHAGDGGLVRQRAIALGLLGRVATGDESAQATARSSAIAAELEDEDLLRRFAQPPR